MTKFKEDGTPVRPNRANEMKGAAAKRKTMNPHTVKIKKTV